LQKSKYCQKKGKKGISVQNIVKKGISVQYIVKKRQEDMNEISAMHFFLDGIC